MINNDSLYEWVFHYNHYNELWSAFQRKDYVQYFNDPSDPSLIAIKSKEIGTLVGVIRKINGDPDKIADL